MGKEKQNRNRFRRWLAAAGLLLCLLTGSMAVFADEPDGTDEYQVPEGNLTLIEDVVAGTEGNREFLTVASKSGNVFYIIINRDNTGEGNVYFLNAVDDSDLYALTGSGNSFGTGGIFGNKKTEVCTCTEKCEENQVNEACAICSQNYEECEGIGQKEQKESTEDKTVKVTGKQKSGSKFSFTDPETVKMMIGVLAVIVMIVLLVLKIRKNKHAGKPTELDMDVYDFEEEDEE